MLMSICQFLLKDPLQQGFCEQVIKDPCPHIFQDPTRIKQCQTIQNELATFNFNGIQKKLTSVIKTIIILLVLILIIVIVLLSLMSVHLFSKK